jgi:hypothetical protein
MRRLAFLLAAVALGATVAAMVASSAAAKTTCAGGVFVGANISGGLVVTGDCRYTNSTISGGVTVTSTGGFEIENSSVSGGVFVQAADSNGPGGEFDAGHVLNSAVATGQPNTITGGIDFRGKDIDLINATVSGGTKITGQGVGYVPQVCGSSLASLDVSGVVGTFTAVHIGDPGEPFQGGTPADCPANTLSGSITLTNSRNVEIEGNTIGGSVTIKDSTLIELAGNTIYGSAHCSNVTPGTDGDHTPNTVGGSSDCP